jgi:hypothetical protein
MSATFTKGPWYEDDGNIFGQGDKLVASQPGYTGDEGDDFFAEYEANGHLLAAAQELLVALEHARAGLVWYQETCPQLTDGSDEEAMALIDAAIAKATGAAS